MKTNFGVGWQGRPRPGFLLVCAVLVTFGLAAPFNSAAQTVEPPGEAPISLEVKEATLNEVAAALSQATRKTIVVAGPQEARAAASGDRYTLRAVKQPFWEVFQQLSQQHGISFVFGQKSAPCDLCIVPSRTGLKNLTVAGDFAIYSSAPQRLPDMPTNDVRLYWGAAMDPRVRIVNARFTLLEGIKDDQGNDLTIVSGNPGRGGMPQWSIWSLGATTLRAKQTLGRKIPLVKGQATFEVALDDKRPGRTKEVVVPFEFKDIVLP